ncbi:hypothetical protein EZS27_011289 [termite gut metagenome]|uniref:Viral histone-like protein n=1 Tax=termite gut metagenome TaxID=433724 RepID=A0A5J4S508_9ZZZZ
MAVQIHRYLRRKVAADPTSPMVYHLKQVPGTSQTHTIKNLAEAIEKKSSLTTEDVIHATSALVREIKEVLLRGDRVKIDGFGIFSLTFNATEVETEKECTIKTINKVNIRFRTDNALRLANESTSGTHGSNDVKFDLALHAGGKAKVRKKTEIPVCGGTTEGRKAVAVCNEAAKPYYYSTKGDGQKGNSAHGIHHTGGLEEKENNSDRLLALTGVNTISQLKPYWENHSCWFRIPNRDESRSIAAKEQFPSDKRIYYQQGEDDTFLLGTLKPEAIITKESGESGGLNEKSKAANRLHITVLVVKRPVLPAISVPKEEEIGFYSLLVKKCHEVCKPLFPEGELNIFLIGEDGSIIKLQTLQSCHSSESS